MKIKTKFKKSNTKYFFTILFLFFNITILIAQNEPAFDDNVIDTPAAPIDDYLLPMLILSLIIGSVQIKKKMK